MTPTLDPDDVRTLIAAQFPQLSPVEVAHLGEGCDSAAFDVNGAWVFRFPKREDVERQLVTERTILPVLERLLPIPIPAFCFHGRPSAAFPRQFGGYPKLSGVPGIQLGAGWLPSPAAAAMLGRFLSVLHAFPIGEAARFGVPEEPIHLVLEEIRDEALSDFGSVRTAAPHAPLGQWRAYLEAGVEDATCAESPLCLVHNDLAAEHILCDTVDETVTGVIDWSDIAIGDVAADFAGMFHWGGDELVARVLPHYQRRRDDRCLVRARFRAACRGVADVAFGLGAERREYVSAGVRALQLCAGGS